MRSYSDLKQVVEELQIKAISFLDCAEEGLWNFRHLNVVHVFSHHHVS